MSFTQVDSGFVDIKHGRIFYRIWGEGDPLVFLNGGPGFSSKGYEEYVERLSKTRKVILFDQRGTGKSVYYPKASVLKVSIWDMVDDLDRLRRHLEIDTWAVMGQSFGGMYAMFYTSKYQSNVSKLILSATGDIKHSFFFDRQYFKDPDPESLSDREKRIILAVEDELKKDEPNQDLVGKLRRAFMARFYVSKPENYARVATWFATKSGSRSINFIGEQFESDLLVRKLKGFEKPVLIIHGLGDFINLSSPLSNHEFFKNSRLEIIEDAGHIIIVDQPEKYVQTIESFLN